jgi:tRNA(fMet)-specific endonuclease VapC
VSFLLDTDICSASLKGDSRVCDRVEQYRGRLYVSAIVAAELFVWVLRAKSPSSRLNALLNLLNDVVFLDVSWKVSRKFGEIRAIQLDRGLPTPQMDLLIASTAILHGLTLVTHNASDYSNVPDLEIVDWMTP